MIWVRQEDPEGCGLAVLAMLTGRTYVEVRSDMIAFYREAWDRAIDFGKRGLIYMDLDRVLGAHGFYYRHLYKTWATSWPPEPFANLHYASVTQPSGRSHFVAVDADGTVLDPLREGRFSLADWPEVGQLVGLRGRRGTAGFMRKKIVVASGDDDAALAPGQNHPSAGEA